MTRGTLHAALLAAVFAATPSVHAEGIEFDFYGSLRLQVEAASPDGASSYNGLRDAYSRLGFRANAPVVDGVSAFAQLELPLDLPNGAVQDPFDNDEDIRIAKVGLTTGFGTFAYGQDWMPYYNVIAYPVDMFSSYYSGFATLTSFRVSDSLFYYSPDLNGFLFGASFSAEGGYGKADGSVDHRYQLTASYSFGDTTLAAGVDDVGGSRNWRFYGLSVMYTMGDLAIGAKAEVIDSDQSADGFGKDGDTAVNLYVGYTGGKNTIKGMVAEVDNYGGTIFHIGVDHAYSRRLTLFAEYYNEDEGAALPTRKATDSAPLDAFGSGGDVFAAGVRYNF